MEVNNMSHSANHKMEIEIKMELFCEVSKYGIV